MTQTIIFTNSPIHPNCRYLKVLPAGLLPEGSGGTAALPLPSPQEPGVAACCRQEDDSLGQKLGECRLGLIVIFRMSKVFIYKVKESTLVPA